MTVGFQSLTDGGGVLQITTEAKSLGFKASGTMTTNASRRGTVNRPRSLTSLFFIEEGKGTFAASRDASNNIYSITSELASASVRWFEFDIVTVAVGTFGLQLFNAAGELAFDSSQRPLVPYYVNPSVAINNGINVPINTSRTYAVSFGGVHMTDVYHSTDPFFGALFRPNTILPKRSGSNLQFQNWDFLGTGVPGGGLDTSPTPVIIIDVTNL